MDKKRKIKKIYALLEERFGDLEWWPAETDFEVVVGAVLTQNTAWSNVEKAIKRLKKKGLMRPDKIAKIRISDLAPVIRPTGYYRVKSGRLQEISRFIMAECGGRLSELKKKGTEDLRGKLLAVKGVGPETADSILLYALGKPVFVVDAYTKRIFFRHGLVPENAPYDEVQLFACEGFPADVEALNQFHALLVETGKRYCKKKDPLCKECPLRGV
ncbi:MAG: endonuclease III domain-containing protein [Candidatus Omnitrophota bacterium]|nr:endonuclease III domain-containing protein [Candidatus Omnitrophota bacterium]